MGGPRLVPIRLGELRLGEEFSTTLTHQRGSVLQTGFVLWDDGTGRRVRLRAALVRYGAVERIHTAEMPVLVEATRPHFRSFGAEGRWSTRLQEPGTFATVGETLLQAPRFRLGDVARVR